MAGSCEHGNEHLGSVEVENFLNSWETEFLKKDSATWS
jgi:hypothetical protein